MMLSILSWPQDWHLKQINKNMLYIDLNFKYRIMLIPRTVIYLDRNLI